MSLDLYSIGAGCTRLQISYAAMLQKLCELNIDPHLRIDGVPHYTDADLSLIREALADQPVSSRARTAQTV